MSIRVRASMELARYLECFPEETEGLSVLVSQLAKDRENVFSRANMLGHITTSALVVDLNAGKVLLIHHKLYDRWLQPGGHYEEGPGSLWDSAEREVSEETGAANSTLHPWCVDAGAPFDIDTHPIAEQPKKNEGKHFHHDFIYLAEADSTVPLVPQVAEVYEARWEPLGHLRSLPGTRFVRLVEKLQKIGVKV